MNDDSPAQLDVAGILSKTLEKIAKANGTTVGTKIGPKTTLDELAGAALGAGVGIDRLLSQASLESFAAKRGHSKRASRDSSGCRPAE